MGDRGGQRRFGISLAGSAPLRVAAIDAGSNAIRFVVAEFGGHAYKVIARLRVPVRLGHRVFTHGALDDDTMDRAVAAFRRFRAELDRLKVSRLRAVATSATREASNRDGFLDRIRVESDIDLEPITGEEEARLVHLAVSRRIDLSRGRWILVDLGGGSIEVSLVDDTGILWSHSYKVGTVRLLETLAAAKGCHDTVRQWVERGLRHLTIPPPDGHPGPAAFAATGGNAEALARLALGNPTQQRPASPEAPSIAGAAQATPASNGPVPHVSAPSVPVSRLDGVIPALAAMTVDQRIKKLRLRPDRADVILPAALVYRHFAALAHSNQMVVPSVGVKEGVLLDVAASIEAP